MKRTVPSSSSITRAATAGSSEPAVTPARSRSDVEGVPNAEASASASRVESGSAPSLSRTSSSSDSGTGSGWSGSTSASSTRASSRAKNGFPPERSWMRSSVCRAKGLSSRSCRRRCSAPTLSGPTASRRTRSSSSACSSSLGPSPSPSRRASSTSMESDSIRRSANASTVDEAGSSHWTSSTAITSCPLSPRSCSTSRTATASARWSTMPPDPSSSRSACSSARRLGGASAGRTSASEPSRRSASPRPAKPRSASAGRDVRSRYPRSRACSTPAAHSVDLPIPASPSSTSAEAPSAGESRKA